MTAINSSRTVAVKQSVMEGMFTICYGGNVSSGIFYSGITAT